MIRIENINKYFNRHKKNQIHVINDTTLNFSSNGLVAILGPSGCGKTTLLNTIGGLDKVSSGNIYIDGQKLTKRSSYKIDEIRNLNIGYIFQDYKLVDSLSVFENVALSLKLLGIKDKDEISKRVMYVLEKVNMTRYRNRPANMLSGGEKQRVGIARALVKNPKIILADEPTGNLDSKNSLEIMNIIKSISKNYLVILVTHEEELARFYATQIIELKDGKVEKNYENNNDKVLNYEVENHIYLKDYKDIKNIKQDNLNIDIYRNNNEELNVKIVFKNGNIYIESNDNSKIEVIDNTSNINLIDDNYKEIKEVKEIDYDIESISNNTKPKYSSIFKFGAFLNYGFKKVLDYPVFKKILLLGFFLSGVFIMYSSASIFATLNIKDENFISINKDYLSINGNLNVDDYLKYQKLDNIEYILPSDSKINFRLYYDTYLQTSNANGILNASLSDISKLNKEDLLYGRMTENDYELVLDKFVLEKFIKNNMTSSVGLFEAKDYLNHEIYLNNMDKFVIVGITNLIEPNVYVNKDMFINMLVNSFNENDYIEDYKIENNNILDYQLYLNDIKLTKGNYPLNDYEVILNKIDENNYKIGDNLDLKINGKNLKVVGFFEDINNLDLQNKYLMNQNTIEYSLVDKTTNYVIYSNDKNKTLKYFKDLKLNIKDSYEYDKNNYIEGQKDYIIGTLTISFIILGISLIEIYLMIRSSFLSRIKEVGIYRAIGVKKRDIYKMFSGEIIIITILSSIPGILFIAYILNCLRGIELLEDMFMVNPFTIILSSIVVLIFNIIVGLLPVYNTIRKTPAAILSRNDVD